MFRNIILSLGILLLYVSAVTADPPKIPVLSGYIRDSATGENLIGANVFVIEASAGTVSNSYGFYSLSLDPGTYTIRYSYVGYNAFEKLVSLNGDTGINIELSKNLKELQEVEVRNIRSYNNIRSLETGTIQLSTESISKIPALLGEVDLIKAVQLLPGVQSTAEGSSGFSVRGGASDQNLILLDEATVYNVSHLMGFFSVFNNDAIKDVKLYKGDIPASSGGRLSSLLEVRMKDGNNKRFSASGGIGLLSSRLTLEGPIFKDKTSFIVSGRRTYADIFLPLSKYDEIKNNKLFFYDINAKVNQIVNDNNRLFISFYNGRDIFKNKYAGFGFGNMTFTFRWNHLFSRKVFSNFSLIHSSYNYELGTPDGNPNSFKWNSDLRDITAKTDLTYYLNPGHSLKFGLASTYHHFLPGSAEGTGMETLFIKYKLPDNFSLEHGIYVISEMKVTRKLGVKSGLRVSALQNVGEAMIYSYDAEYKVTDSSYYPQNKIFHTYAGIEPRLGITYSFNDLLSIKASYARTRQYMQLAQNSTAGTPLDVWFSAGPNIRPQISDQLSFGVFRNFMNSRVETSVETYYKKMRNTIDFRDHANLLLNRFLEGEIRSGFSISYGIEFLVKLSDNRLSGWLAYSLSKTTRTIRDINNGKAYPAPYDKPNSIAVVANYQLWKRVGLGMNWVYSTGNPVSFPTGRYEILGSVIPSYTNRNDFRMPPYHRLDLSISIAGRRREGKRWQGEWNISAYNAYARKNAWAINFVQDSDNPAITYAEKTYLFSIIPAITYNFRF